MTYLIACALGELTAIIGAFYYAYTLYDIGWCPRVLLVCFALSSVLSLASSLLDIALEVRKRKFAKVLAEIAAYLAAQETPPSERN